MSNKKINRIKVMLAEKEKTNKWLAEQVGERSCYHLQMVYQYGTT